MDSFALELKRTTALDRREKRALDIFWTIHLKLVLFCLLFKMFVIAMVTGKGVDNPQLFTSHTTSGMVASIWGTVGFFF